MNNQLKTSWVVTLKYDQENCFNVTSDSYFKVQIDKSPLTYYITLKKKKGQLISGV